jgi:hypothetical protein
MTGSRALPWVLAALTLALGAAAAPSLMTMQDHDVSLAAYQLAATSDRAAELNARLGEEGLDALRTSLWWDYPFLVCLGVLLAILCLRSGRRAAALGQGRLASAGRVFAGAALVYLVCDAVENALLFRIADGETGQPWPGITFVVASVKFLALLSSVGYLVVALVLRRRQAALAPGIGRGAHEHVSEQDR